MYQNNYRNNFNISKNERVKAFYLIRNAVVNIEYLDNIILQIKKFLLIIKLSYYRTVVPDTGRNRIIKIYFIWFEPKIVWYCGSGLRLNGYKPRKHQDKLRDIFFLIPDQTLRTTASESVSQRPPGKNRSDPI